QPRVSASSRASANHFHHALPRSTRRCSSWPCPGLTQAPSRPSRFRTDAISNGNAITGSGPGSSPGAVMMTGETSEHALTLLGGAVALSPCKEFTPGTQHTKPDRQRQHHRVGDQVATFTMDQLIMPLAQAHEADARDIRRDDGGAGKARPQQVLRG